MVETRARKLQKAKEEALQEQLKRQQDSIQRISLEKGCRDSKIRSNSRNSRSRMEKSRQGRNKTRCSRERLEKSKEIAAKQQEKRTEASIRRLSPVKTSPKAAASRVLMRSLFTPPPDPPVAKVKQQTWPRWLSCLVLVSILLVIVEFNATIADEKVYCSSFNSETNCQTCPRNAICVDGRISKCRVGFVRLKDDTCALNAELQADISIMRQEIESYVERKANRHDETFQLQIQKIQLEFKERATTMGDAMFDFIFINALYSSSLDIQGQMIQVEPQSSSSTILWISFLIGTSTVLLVQFAKQRAARKVLFNRYMELVKSQLIRQKVERSKGYFAQYLQLHVADLLRLTPAEAKEAKKHVWPRICQHLAQHPQIDQKTIFRHDQSLVYWIWR